MTDTTEQAKAIIARIIEKAAAEVTIYNRSAFIAQEMLPIVEAGLGLRAQIKLWGSDTYCTEFTEGKRCSACERIEAFDKLTKGEN